MKILKKIFELLSPSEQRRAVLLFLLILVMAFLDTLGVASILPFVAVLADPDLIRSNIILNFFYLKTLSFGFQNDQQFIFLLGIISFLFLLISLFFRALTTYFSAKFSLMREYSIGNKLITKYLFQSYSWFINQHSANLSKNILSEVKDIVENTIVPIINVIVYGAISIFLFTFLIFINYKLAITVGFVLILNYLIIFYFMQKILKKIGNDRQKANKQRFIVINETFAAIKEIKLGGYEDFYLERFSKFAKTYARNQSLAVIIGQVPRYFIEGVVFGGMILLVLILISSGNSFGTIAPILTIYAFCGYRMMPSLQQVYNALTKLRYSKESLNIFHHEFININQNKTDGENNFPITFKKNIQLKNIIFNYPNSNKKIFNEININLPVFSKIGILGPSGSGKTTLVDIITGLLKPTKGNVLIDGVKLNSNNIKNWQNKIGYVPQQIYLSDSSIASNIAFGEKDEEINYAAIEKAAKDANIHDFVINNLENKYQSFIGEKGIKLSGGQKQRIGIARALYKKPKVLIMDEGTNALDNDTELAVMESINNLDKDITLILITHKLSTVKNCDIILSIKNGKIIQQ